MKVHKHARMTVHGRYLLVCRVRQEGWRVKDAAAAAGISARTGREAARAAAGYPQETMAPPTLGTCARSRSLAGYIW